MARPRSIVGLLLLAWFAWSRLGGERSPQTPGDRGLQAAVLKDGFAVTYTGDAGRRVVEIDAQGQRRREVALPLRDDLRLVGTSIGSVVGWQDDKKLRLARIDDITEADTFGHQVRQLCEGVASNAQRFGVGWLEGDDTVWVLHGPAADAADGEHTAPIALGAPARNDWCGVASAEQNIALMWRSGDRMSIVMCSKRACSNLPASFTLDRRLPLLGVGCLRNACLLATRDESGRPRLSLVTTTGRGKWNQPVAASGAVSIVAAGDRAFAVGYAGPDGAEVIRLDRDGKVTALLRDPAAGAPALAWSAGRLLIARFRGDALIHDTVALAR
ncbi:MAG TPA: hypothetical protein VFD36_12275 [Kofleriaceae bacterium]|nr:hypothetical protein [Kofleriaceae bacterium]